MSGIPSTIGKHAIYFDPLDHLSIYNVLKKNLTEEMDAGGARNKRKHITHRKKNIKNRKINIKHKKRVTKNNKIFRRVN